MAQVLRLENAGRRTAIQSFTRAQCYPDVIQFIQDANDEWVTDLNVLNDLKYNRPGNKSQVVDVLIEFGDVIEFEPKLYEETIRPGRPNKTN